MRTTICLALLVSSIATVSRAQLPARSHDRAYWLAMKDTGFAVPEGTDVRDVLIEMNTLLASDDPVLRDEVAYSAAERWILRDKRLGAGGLRTLRDLWLSNLKDGLGTTGSNTVFKRSFSALCLSVVAAADVATPFMTEDEFNRFLDDVLDYFARERDLRGFDQARGWMHAVAHTADLMKFLARNPKLGADQAGRVASAIAAKLRIADAVFQWGEADRLALALLPIVRRYPSLLEPWLQPWPGESNRLWANGPHVDARQFALVENVKQVLRSLHAYLQAITAQPGGPAHGEAASATAVLRTLTSMR